MPIVFGVIGIVLIVAGIRDTVTGSNPNIVTLIKGDLTGEPNYIEWMIAIFILGALGYIPSLRTLSRLFMTLVVIGLILSNKGFFAKFTQQTTTQPSGSASLDIETPGSGTTNPATGTTNISSSFQNELGELEAL